MVFDITLKTKSIVNFKLFLFSFIYFKNNLLFICTIMLSII